MTVVQQEKEGIETASGRLARVVTRWQPGLHILAVVMAVSGQLSLTVFAGWLWGALLFVGAGALFIYSLSRGSRSEPGAREQVANVSRRTKPLVRERMWRAALLVNSVILAGAALWAFEGNRLDRGFWIWAGAIIYYSAAFMEYPAGGIREGLRLRLERLDVRWLVVGLCVVAIALAFRTFRLIEVPIDMTSDHAEKLLDVRDVVAGARPIFFTRNTGREALQFYLTAGLAAVTSLPVGFLVLKLGAALTGWVTVPATYFLGKELWGKRAGMVGAFLLAISQWHVAISRVGLRFPFTAAFATPALYFLLRAVRENRRNLWLTAGGFLGLGLHSYTAMRIVPVLIVYIVVVRFAFDAGRWVRARRGGHAVDGSDWLSLQRSFWANAFCGAGLALLLFLPLLRYSFENPAGFWYRAASRAQAGLAPGEMWVVFWQNVKNAVLMFNVRGDVVPMNTIPESPVLDPVSGALFVLGVIYLLWQLKGGVRKKALYTLGGMFIMLLPSIMSLAYPGENPSVARAGGAVPWVMIIAALPLASLMAGGPEGVGVGGRRKYCVTFFVALLLMGSLLSNFRWYFEGYDENIRRSIWNSGEMGAVVADFVRQGGQANQVYHIAYPHWVDTRNIGIMAGMVGWENAVTELAELSEQAKVPGQKMYILFPLHQEAIVELRRLYPEGQLREYDTERPGKAFLLFEVPDEAMAPERAAPD